MPKTINDDQTEMTEAFEVMSNEGMITFGHEDDTYDNNTVRDKLEATLDFN